MKWIIFIVTLTLTVILFTVVFSPHATIKSKQDPQKTSSEQQLTMTITSSAFQANSKIPSKYTCDGQDTNPPLIFSDVPSSTTSLVLIVDDPDAPGGTWHHWSVYNIDPKTTGFNEGSKPSSGKEGITDFGKSGYGGPCPPSGDHHYHFKLYALDSMLDLPEKATLNEINNAMANHIISEAELIGVYSRSN